MEKNLFWLQDLDYHSPNLNYLADQLSIEQPDSIPAHMKPYYSEGYPNGSFPSVAWLPQSRASQPNEITNWFYCPSRFHQAFVPVLNRLPEQKLPAETIGEEGHANLTFGTGHAQKRFLVFDQSGDKTTLLYSSGIGSHVPCLNDLNHKPPKTCDWFKEEPAIINKDVVPGLEPFLVDELDEENQKDGVESDMHEDTEELNALLYSDDDYSEDDEETSTGHSPSSMTVNRMQDWFEAKDEEVASSAGSTKRHKLSDGGYDTPSAVMDAAVMDTASSFKCASKSEQEEDAESSCGNGPNEGTRGFSSLSGKKRIRKDFIRETVHILQEVIPDGKGKDTMVVIDEAIHYLKSLKAKAKDLGLGAL